MVSTISKSCNKYLATLAAIALLSGASTVHAADNSVAVMAKINAGIPLVASDLQYISNYSLIDPKVRAALSAYEKTQPTQPQGNVTFGPGPATTQSQTSSSSSSTKCAPAGSIVIGPTPACGSTTTSNNTSSQDNALQNELSGLQSQLSNLTSNQNAEYEALKQKVANSANDLAQGKCAPAGSIVIGPTPACPTTADLANLIKSQEAAKTALQSKISQVQNQLTSTAQNAVNNVVNTATNQITGQVQGAANTALTNATASLKGLFPGAASCGNFENVYIAELGASTCGKISESSLGNLNDMLSKMFSAQLNSAIGSVTSSIK